MNCYIQHIVTAVPPLHVNLEETLRHLADIVPDARTLQRVERILAATGIRKRHLAALELQLDRPPESRFYPPRSLEPRGPSTQERLEAGDRLASTLLDRLLLQLPADWASVTRLVTATCTLAGSPGLERVIFRNPSIDRGVDRWHLAFMGCSAGLAGLRLVRALHEQKGTSEEAAASLVVALELSSLHVQYSDRIDQLVANALFADGASAVLVSPRPSPYRVVACRCVTLHAAADQMIWQVGNHGFELHLAAELPDTLAAHIEGAVVEFLADNDLRIPEVRHWAIHPGGPKIIDVVCRALSLTPEAGNDSRAVLAEFGNMSSATVFFILQRMFDAGARGPIMALAFGPGLTIELALLEGLADAPLRSTPLKNG